MAESPGAGTREVSWDAVGFAGYCPTQPWLKAERARGEGDGPQGWPCRLLGGWSHVLLSYCSWQVLSKGGMTTTLRMWKPSDPARAGSIAENASLLTVPLWGYRVSSLLSAPLPTLSLEHLPKLASTG